MAAINLSDYNLAELKGLQFDVENEIKERQRQELGKAREQIRAIASEAGISVESLMKKGGGRLKALAGPKADGLEPAARASGPKAAARYRNPANGAQTWSGRGRQPKWIAEALAGGTTLDAFKVADAKGA